MADYVFDPITGMPMADPSGVLQSQGYEKMPADAAERIGENATAAVKDAAGALFVGLKVVVVIALLVVAVVVVAEVRKAIGK